MGFGDYDFATNLRDMVRNFAKKEINTRWPGPRYARVISIDRVARRCEVIYDDAEALSVPVKMGVVQPSATQQVVRIDGPNDDRYISDVMGVAYIENATFDPTAHPEVMSFPASVLTPRPSYGTAPLSDTASAWWVGLGLDPATTSFVGAQAKLPPPWKTLNIDVAWVGSDATVGDVDMRSVHRSTAAGAVLGASGGTAVVAANSTITNTLQRTRLNTGISCTSSSADGLFFAGVERRGSAGTDTYAGRMIVLELTLTRVT